MPQTLRRAEQLVDDYGISEQLADAMLVPFDSRYSTRAIRVLGENSCKTTEDAKARGVSLSIGAATCGAGTYLFMKMRLGLP